MTFIQHPVVQIVLPTAFNKPDTTCKHNIYLKVIFLSIIYENMGFGVRFRQLSHLLCINIAETIGVASNDSNLLGFKDFTWMWLYGF